ncbi:PRD domain-containing protein [Bacillus cereus]|nr:PRD domain-containing protein [Bacillus cereus]
MQRYILNFDIPSRLEKNIKINIRYYRIKVDINSLNIILKVCINRIMQKKILNKKKYPEDILDSSQKQCLNNIIEEIEKSFSLNFPENEKKYLYTAFFLIAEIPTIQTIKNNISFCLFKKHNLLEYNEIFNVIKNKLTMSNNLKEQFDLDVMYHLYKIFLLKKGNFPIPYYSSTETNLKEFSEISQGINLLVKDWNVKLNTPILSDSEILFISNKIAYTFYTDVRNIKVLVTLSGSNIWKKVIHSKLYKELHGNFNLLLEFDDNDTYDFIISNYQIKNAEVPVIIISDELKTKEIVSINEIFTKEAKRRGFVQVDEE